MGKNRRNHENTNEVVKENHKELTLHKKELKEIRSDVATILELVQKSTYQKLMEGPDISEFFPVEKHHQLVDFMDRSHPEWPARRDAFYMYLFNCVHDSKKAFTKGLLKMLFSRQYMLTVKWPKKMGYYFLKNVFFFRINITCFIFRTNKPGEIPSSFVAFLQASLSKMVGNQYLKRDIIDLDFWSKMSLKFCAIKNYDKSLVIIYSFFIIKLLLFY